jgi:hypothetical protein
VIAVAAIAVFIGQVTDNRIIFAIAFGLYVVALAPLGRRILTESDEEWVRESAPPAAAAAPGGTV